MAQPTVTSNFAGKSAGFYISAALNQAKSLEYLTAIENIKYKSNIQKMGAADVVRNAACDFTAYGALNLTEAILTPKNLQINLDLCKLELLDSWEALEMRAGAGAPTPQSFNDYVISYMGEQIANSTENSIWNGNDLTQGQFTGFVTGGAVGHMVAAGNTVVDVAATAPFTAANIVANLAAVTATIPSAVYTKEDLFLYVSAKTYRIYINQMSTLGYINAYSMNKDYDAVFEGINLAVCPGMPDDTIVAAEKSNMFFGTDLLSDSTRIDLLDMSQLDGSDNMRLVARYTGGTQIGIGADIVLAQ